MSECLPSGSSNRRAEVSQSYFTLHFLLTVDVEHLSRAFCANSIGSLMKCLLSSLAHFNIRLFSYCLVLRVVYFRLQSFIKCVFCKCFSQTVFSKEEIFHFNEVQLISCFINCASDVVPTKSLPNTRSSGFSPLLPSRNQFCGVFRLFGLIVRHMGSQYPNPGLNLGCVSESPES